MSTLEQYRDHLGEHAKDTRVNLGNVLTEDGSPGLSQRQIVSAALACAYYLGEGAFIEALEGEFPREIAPEDIASAKAAASIMAMNNVYYRFMHLSEDSELSKMPARLRMQVIGKPPTDKPTFEILCLAVSALSGCGNCIKAHIQELRKAGVSNEGIQSAARIAAVINATHVSQRIK